jgi:hypothetical protein
MARLNRGYRLMDDVLAFALFQRASPQLRRCPQCGYPLFVQAALEMFLEYRADPVQVRERLSQKLQQLKEPIDAQLHALHSAAAGRNQG